MNVRSFRVAADDRPLHPTRRVAIVLGLAAAAILLAIGFALAGMRIASERAAVARLDRLTAARAADVRRLETDYEIRSRLPEVDRWGADLSLAPPDADQYAHGGRSVLATAEARRQALEVRDTRAVMAAGRPAYPRAARERLDDLIGQVGGAGAP